MTVKDLVEWLSEDGVPQDAQVVFGEFWEIKEEDVDPAILEEEPWDGPYTARVDKPINIAIIDNNNNELWLGHTKLEDEYFAECKDLRRVFHPEFKLPHGD